MPESASQLNTEQRQPDDQPQLEIFPIGSVDAMSVSVVAANLQAILGLNTKVQVPLPEPEYAFLPRRGQYDSGRIIQRLAADNAKCSDLGWLTLISAHRFSLLSTENHNSAENRPGLPVSHQQ